MKTAFVYQPKKAAYLYPDSFVGHAIQNAKKHSWAQNIQQTIIKEAAYWHALSYDELWDKMFQPSIGPRSLMVWSDGYCPSCGKTVGMYAWETDHENRPWKVACPFCGDLFPKNDYKAFFDSGINRDTGLFSYEEADKTLLINTEHPSTEDPQHQYGVDDGRGYTDGKNRWYFVGYYIYRCAWNADILEGIKKLSMAYMVTGDGEYARRAAILLDRTADFFTEFEYYSQGLVYEISSSTGYITYRIDSASDVLHMARAYDRIFNAIKEDQVLAEFLSSKARQFPRSHIYETNKKESFADIQRNIEEHMFLHVLQNPDRILTNFPGTDIAITTIHTVLGWEHNRELILEKITEIADKSTHTDGTTGEHGLPNYTAFAAHKLSNFLAEYAYVEEDLLATLFVKCPNLKKTWRFYVDTMCLYGYYPHIGDAGNFARKVDQYRGVVLWQPGDGAEQPHENPIPSLYTFLWRLYELSGDAVYAKLMYIENKNSADGLPYDIFLQSPESIGQGVLDIVQKHGTDLNVGSVDKMQYHLALMRRPEDKNPVFWLDYDAGGHVGHFHYDGLNLGLYAYGLDLMTDFGYPPVNKDGWTGPWTAWYRETYSHNTVLVDSQCQVSAEGRINLWHDGEGVRALRADGRGMYGQCRYERTVVMVDMGKEHCYLVDVFRVDGGKRHDRLMSTQYAKLTTSGLNLKPADNPWAHVEACRVGMTDFRIDVNPEDIFEADFEIEDRYNYGDDKSKVHVKYTDMTESTQVYVFDAWVQESFNNPIESTIPRIATTREGKEPLRSTFVGIIEPYKDFSKIDDIKRLELRDDAGAISKGNHVAIEITQGVKTKELIIIKDVAKSAACEYLYQKDWALKTNAELLVMAKDRSGKTEIKARVGGEVIIDE